MQRIEDLSTEERKRKLDEVMAHFAATGQTESFNQDMLTLISNHYLSLSEARRFANTCRQFLFFTNKLKPVIRRANAEVHQFLNCVLNSDLARAREMLLLDPGLVWEVQTIGEHGQVNGLQLGRNIGDAGMCEMMLNCAAGKIDASLPANTNQKKSFELKHFDDIADAIANAARKNKLSITAEKDRHRNPEHQMTALSHAMDSFRKICDAHGEMTPQDIINAFLALVKHWDKLKSYDEVNLFFLQVIGYIERLCPVWFRQALVEGINNLLQPDAVLQRVTECNVSNVNYPLVSLIPSSGLGFDFACDDFCLAVHERVRGGACGEWPLEKFCGAAESKFGELSRRGQPKADEPEAKRLKN
jgi:hypothetical protein